MKDNIVQLLLCFDDNFTGPAYALIKSSIDSKKSESIYIFNIYYSDPDILIIELFESLVKNSNVKIKWIDSLPSFTNKGLLSNNNLSLAAQNGMYGRIHASEYLSNEIEKIIYLDVDILIHSDLSELFNIDLHDNLIGAVVDPYLPNFSFIKSNFAQKLINNRKSPFFNSGVMLINLKKWKEFMIVDEFRKILFEYDSSFIFVDQEILNFISLKYGLHQIDKKWNYLLYTSLYKSFGFYPHNEVDWSPPAISHYAGDYTPWTDNPTSKTSIEYSKVKLKCPEKLKWPKIKLKYNEEIRSIEEKYPEIPELFLAIRVLLNNSFSFKNKLISTIKSFHFLFKVAFRIDKFVFYLVNKKKRTLL